MTYQKSSASLQEELTRAEPLAPSPRRSEPRLKRPFGFEVAYRIHGEAPLHNVLLTENQPMELRVANVLLRDGETIILDKIETVSVEDHHFLIQFKTGQLASATTTVEGSDWAVLRKEDATTGTTNVYLAWKSAAKRLDAGETLSIVFRGLYAQANAVQSLPMFLSWPEPAIEGDTHADSPLRIVQRIPDQGNKYETEAYVILEKRVWGGRSTIPLRLDIVGLNQVVNVGNEESALMLRVTNCAPSGSQGEDVEFKYVASVTDRSFLRLKVPIGTIAARPFAVSTKDQANGITRALSGWTVQAGSANADSTEMHFGFVPNATVKLKPGEYLDIALSKVVTSHPSGIAHLELEYGKLPGFRDGKLTVAVEKLPMKLDANGNLLLKWNLDDGGRFKDKTGAVTPVGTVVAFGGSTAPAGWLLCDGRSVSTTMYPDLYAVLGATFGSAASGQFRVPDLRVSVPIGASATYNLGSTGGAINHVLTTSEMPLHLHEVTDPGHRHQVFVFNDNGVVLGDGMDSRQSTRTAHIPATAPSQSGISIQPAGGSSPHNNMQPYLVVNYIIKC